jgi:hypothetical protein
MPHMRKEFARKLREKTRMKSIFSVFRVLRGQIFLWLAIAMGNNWSRSEFIAATVILAIAESFCVFYGQPTIKTAIRAIHPSDLLPNRI